jgi:hypothetical protein
MHVEQEQQYITETISGFAPLPQHCSLLIKNIIIVITFYRAMCSTLSEQHQGIGEAPNISGHMMKQKNGHHMFPVCVLFHIKSSSRSDSKFESMSFACAYDQQDFIWRLQRKP